MKHRNVKQGPAPAPVLSGIARSLLFALAACLGTDASASVVCDPIVINTPYRKVDFDRDIQPFFDRECVACHQPESEGFATHRLDLRAGHSYRNLVGIPSAQAPERTLVIPFDPDFYTRSFLWEKLICDKPTVGDRMPRPDSRISGLDTLALYAWIARGAPPGAEGIDRRYEIEPGLAGSWYDPSVPGQGFSVEVVEGPRPLFVVYWLTFSQEFSNLIGGDAAVSQDLRWMTAVGEYQPGASFVDLKVERFVYGLFDETAVRPSSQRLGTARLSFQSCREATFRYDVKLDNDESQRVQRTIVLRRLTPRPSCGSKASTARPE